MIIPKDKDRDLESALPIPEESPPPFTELPAASGSQPNPRHSLALSNEPHLEEENSHLLNDLSSPSNESPPEFTVFAPEFTRSSSGNVTSHDPHLNSDGEALYRFILSETYTRPNLLLHCRGSHDERRYRHVTERDSNGRTTHRQESYDENIVDFDFYLDVGQYLTDGPISWTVADPTPAYRGSMVMEVETPDRAVAHRRITKPYNKWLNQRDSDGLPPWQYEWAGNPVKGGDVLNSSKTIRQWADQYCASPKQLKEFVYEKHIYGWNFSELESTIRSNINQSLYSGHIQVAFERSGHKIYIRPDNKLSRMLSKKWLKVLLIILCIYPFIWLYKRFNKHGGGRWEVCSGAWPLQRTVPVDPIALAAEGNKLQPGQTIHQNIDGQLLKTVGLSEGIWLQEWRGTILKAVSNRFQSSAPLIYPTTPRQSAIPMLAIVNDLV